MKYFGLHNKAKICLFINTTFLRLKNRALLVPNCTGLHHKCVMHRESEEISSLAYSLLQFHQSPINIQATLD